MSSVTRQKVLDLNAEQVSLYRQSTRRARGQEYWGGHPLEIAITQCSDGRVHPVSWLGMPSGLATQMIDIGGNFRLGDTHFQALCRKWTRLTTASERFGLFVTTYHFSASKRELGCKGFKFNREEAMEATAHLRAEFDRAFGSRQAYSRKVFHSIQVGLETDRGSLVLHGAEGATLHTAELQGANESALLEAADRLYPRMDQSVQRGGVVTILRQNIAHLQRTSKARPVEELDHNETVLAVGGGFDWFHTPNLALTLGPFDDFERNVAIAAGIIQGNIEAGRVDCRDGILLLACAPVYTNNGEGGCEKVLAELMATNYAQRALKIIRTQVPGLIPCLDILVATVDMSTFQLHELETSLRP